MQATLGELSDPRALTRPVIGRAMRAASVDVEIFGAVMRAPKELRIERVTTREDHKNSMLKSIPALHQQSNLRMFVDKKNRRWRRH